MRAKDAARLSVLRGVISSTLNASKTPFPIATDVALIALLRKQARQCTDARDEFAAAGRSDLVDKEAAQIAVLEEYIAGSGVEEIGGKQLEAVVEDAVAVVGGGGKPKMGDVLKLLLEPGGLLDGKDIDKAALVRHIKHTTKMIGRSSNADK